MFAVVAATLGRVSRFELLSDDQWALIGPFAAHSAGALSKIGTGLVGAASGGHRHGTHAPLVAAAVVAAALWLANGNWIEPVRFTPSW